MQKLRKPVYLAAGAYTVSLGSGRKEFDPKKARPGVEYYMQEAGKMAISQTKQPENIDEGVVGNFMAARFNKQGHLAAFLPSIHPSLQYKPMVRVEGACCSGGLAMATGIKNVLTDLADAVLVVGVEVQNTVKAIYGADILAGAGYYAGERKAGHAYFFPAKFSDRAGAYFARYGKDKTRQAMATWYTIAVEHARLNPLSQENQNTTSDLMALGMTAPNAQTFTEYLNLYDCSKVSDGGAAIIVCSEAGYKKLGLSRSDVCEVVGLGQAEDNIMTPPPDLTELTTSKKAVDKALCMAGIDKNNLGVLEVHDCFTITGLLSLEAIGLADKGTAADFVSAGNTRLSGTYPTNTSGGLIGYGHPTGASGVRQAVDLWKQLTGKSDKAQLKLSKEHGLMISMGGNDKTVVSLAVKK
jgi:acetyl-CoA C-acetyltransferase/acetyl-CoA acyltransferase